MLKTARYAFKTLQPSTPHCKRKRGAYTASTLQTYGLPPARNCTPPSQTWAYLQSMQTSLECFPRTRPRAYPTTAPRISR